MVRVEPRRRMTVSRSSEAGGGSGNGGPTAHGSPRRSPSPACCVRVTSGNSVGAASTAPRTASSAGRIAGSPSSRRDQRERELVDAIGADEARHLGVGEARPQARPAPGRFHQRQGLGEHRAGIPVDVPQAALGVFPAGPPRDAGDDQRRGRASRRRADVNEPVADWVIPMHAVRKTGHPTGRDVDLEREAPAGRSGRPEQPSPASQLLDTNDSRGEVEQPGESGQIDGGRRCNMPAGQDGGRRSQDWSPIAWQLDDRQTGRIRLARRRQACHVQRDEVRQQARVADRDGPAGLRPLQPGPVP